MIHRGLIIFVITVSVFVSLRASAECKKPSNGFVSFRATDCRGNAGHIFTGDEALGRTVFEAMAACRALDSQWHKYCGCEGKSLNATPVSKPAELEFKIVDCQKKEKDNMVVFCGTYNCDEQDSSSSSSSSSSPPPSSSSSSSPFMEN
jgi:hypothetical protein